MTTELERIAEEFDEDEANETDPQIAVTLFLEQLVAKVCTEVTCKKILRRSSPKSSTDSNQRRVSFDVDSDEIENELITSISIYEKSLGGKSSHILPRKESSNLGMRKSSILCGEQNLNTQIGKESNLGTNNSGSCFSCGPGRSNGRRMRKLFLCRS